MEKDKELDNLFKRGFDDPAHQPGFREDDWDAMETMLEGNKKRAGIVQWLPILGAVAAVLLIVFGLWVFVHKTPEKQQAAVNRIPSKNMPDTIQKNYGISHGSAQSNKGNYASTVNTTTPADRKQGRGTAIPASLAGNTSLGIKGRPVITVSDGGGRRNTTRPEEQLLAVAVPDKQFLSSATTVLLAGMPGSQHDTIAPANFMPKDNYGVIAANKVKAKAITSVYKPQFAITVLGSSDMNGVNSFSQSKVGTNVGVLFSAGIIKRLTISTGAIYSSKPYITNIANYHGGYIFPSAPTTVNADCRMIDVPLNLDYNLYNKHRNKFSVGTGISSYLMFHEAYNYTYGYYGSGPSTYNVPNPGKYYLSILNLQATYQRRINSKLGLDVQPYMKLPLSGVGLYNSKLQSTGVAIGLTWSLGKN